MPPIEDWLTFIHTPEFDEEWDELGLDDEDLARLQSVILANSEAGDLIAGTGGLRKLRFAPEGKGKSGGCRVCYASFPKYGIVILTLVYGKRAKADLTLADRKAIAGLLKQFEAEFKRREEEF